MSIVCPYRHLSYAQWRFQVFQTLFYPGRLHNTSHSAPNEPFRGHTRPGQHRDFAILRQYATRSRNKVGSEKKAKITQKTQKQIAEEEVSGSLQRASERVSGRLDSEPLIAPAELPGSAASLEKSGAEPPDHVQQSRKNIAKPQPDNNGPAANLNDLKGGPNERPAGSTKRKGVHPSGRHQYSGEGLQRWSGEAKENASRHEQMSPTRTQNLDQNQERQILGTQSPSRDRNTSHLHPVELSNHRTPRPAGSTGLAGVVSPEDSTLEEPLSEAEWKPKNLQDPIDEVYEGKSYVSKGAVTTEKPSSESPVGYNKTLRRPIGQDSPYTNEAMDPASHHQEKSSRTLTAAVHQRKSGELSAIEHEQVSALLSSLRSKLAQVEDLPSTASEPVDDLTLERKVEVSKLSESLPISPYQRLQGKERRMKQQAKAKAKQRLQDNPWAQWLASPVRMCQATGVRLPNKLMVNWNFVKNPKDDEIYLMPEELADITHLGAGNRNTSFSGGSPNKMDANEPVSRDEMKNRQEGPIGASDHASHPTSISTEQIPGQGSQSPAIAISDPPNINPPLAPAKLYMRPSSILLLELNKRFLLKLAKKGKGSAKARMTHAPIFSRLIPNRWKEQARRFALSSDAENHQSGILMTEEMRNVQWHPRIHDVMLNLLRLRVIKALENVALKNGSQFGLNRQIISLPTRGEIDYSDGEAAAIGLSGIDQAVVFWLGNLQAPGADSNYHDDSGDRLSRPQPLNPSTSHSHTLQIYPRKASAPSNPSSLENGGRKQEQTFIPIWTEDPTRNEFSQDSNSQQGQQYLPPSIQLQIQQHQHHSNSNTSSPINNATTTSRTLPIFDLPFLLGGRYMKKLHANQPVADALNLNNRDAARGGWVMVKGGSGTEGFKALVQEVWRLWLFVGGRRWGEHFEEARGEGKLAEDGESDSVWRELPLDADAGTDRQAREMAQAQEPKLGSEDKAV